MKVKTNLIIIFSLIVFVACRSYVQVYETSSELDLNQQGYYRHEDDTVKILYTFWYSQGLMSFTVFNKTNRPLYIDWKKSSYIDNSVKLDYWRDESKIEQKSIYGAYTPKSNPVILAGNTYSTVSKNERITFIPPNSNYSKTSFIILPINGIKLDGEMEKSVVNLKYKRNILVDTYSKEYSKLESPLVFRNYLTLSFSEDFEDEFHVDNEFYISKVVEVDSRAFEHYKYDTLDSRRSIVYNETNRPIKISDYKKSSSFYIRIAPEVSVDYRKAYKE